MTMQIGRPWRILVISIATIFVLLLIVLGLLSVALSTQAGSGWVVAQVTDRLNQADNSMLSIGNSRGTLFRGLTLQQVRFTNAALEVDVEEIQASWNPFSLLSNSFYLSGLQISNLEVTAVDAPVDQTDSLSETTTLVNFSPLPIAIEVARFNVSDAQLTVNAQTYQLDNLTLDAQLDQYQLQLGNVDLSAGPVNLDGSFNVNLQDSLPLQARFSWQYNDALAAGIESLAGEISLDGDTVSLAVMHQLHRPVSVQSNGTLQTGLDGSAQSFDLRHSADNLQLPLEQAADYFFDELILHTSGTLDEVELDISTSVRNELLPELAVTGQALFRQNKLDVTSYTVASTGGEISGSVNLDWSDGWQGQGVFSLADQNPLAYIDVSLPLELQDLLGSGNFEFQLQEQDLSAALTVENLSGLFGDYPFAGRGEIVIADGGISFDRVELETADNALRIGGSLTDVLDVNWEIRAPVLQQIAGELRGSALASGTLRGDPSDPDLNGIVQVRDLHYENIRVESLELSLDWLDGAIDATLALASASVQAGDASQQIQSLLLEVSGSESSHAVMVSGSSDYGSATMTLQGNFSDTPEPQWQATLLRGYLETIAGNWDSIANAQVLVSAAGVNLDTSCWSQQQASVCVELQQSPEFLTVTAAIQEYPLETFNAAGEQDVQPGTTIPGLQILPETLGLNGTASASLVLSAESGEPPIVDFSVQSNDALLTILATTDDEQLQEDDAEEIQPQHYVLNTAMLSGRSSSGQWDLNGSIRFSRQNIEGTDLALQGLLESDMIIGADQSLTGSVRAGLQDLGWLEAIVPEISGISGSLNSEIFVSGNLDAPLISGNLEIANGQLQFDQTGILISELSASVNSSVADTIELYGRATSGEGVLEFAGSITDPYLPSRAVQAQLSGQDFQLANIPDLILAVSPTIAMTADSEAIEFTGSLDIPVLQLQMSQLPETAVDISRDAIVVDYPPDQPQLARSVASQQSTLFDIPVMGNITINLGEEVSFSGLGMAAKLNGNLDIKQQSNGANLTYGEVTITEGSYQIYGQQLILRRGKLLFFGAYDNPALDIRAVRELENATVGVLMNGTLKNINSQLFSSPALADSDIIAMIVTGRPFSEMGTQDSDAVLGAVARLGLDRGQGLTNQIRDKLGLDTLAVESRGNINNSMLTIGKYISPDVFVRYGVGLFDNRSKLAIDYSVNDRVKLQAESGEYQSLDLTYTVER